MFIQKPVCLYCWPLIFNKGSIIWKNSSYIDAVTTRPYYKHTPGLVGKCYRNPHFNSELKKNWASKSWFILIYKMIFKADKILIENLDSIKCYISICGDSLKEGLFCSHDSCIWVGNFQRNKAHSLTSGYIAAQSFFVVFFNKKVRPKISNWNNHCRIKWEKWFQKREYICPQCSLLQDRWTCEKSIYY